MKIDDQRLMAFADGELDAAAAAEVARAIDSDPVLAEVVRRHRALRARLREALAPALAEPVPPGMRELLMPAPADELAVQRARRRRVRDFAPARWLAVAALLVVGIGVASLMRATGPDVRTLDDGVRVAGGELLDALERQLASEPAGPVAIRLTFRDVDGQWCRTFELAGAQPRAGLACRDGLGRWQVPVLAPVAAATGTLRQASSPQVLEAVDARIAGEPAGAEAERRARDGGWR